MIIQSLLDTDLYKFTMMQVVLHHFPGAQVEYRFRCRTEGVNLRPHLDAIRGPWLHTILFEIPVLSIISEVYFRRTQPRPDLDEGRRRLRAKIDLVRTVEPELEFKISDFGTRRRFSAAWHEEVLQTLKREMPQY